MGDRQHLLSASITLDTFIDDICAVIETEELQDVFLVGHSFGGVVITGVADRMAARLSHLIYLDGRMVDSGQSIIDVTPERGGDWLRMAQAGDGLSVPPPPAATFGCQDPADLAWIERRLTPQPIGTFTKPLQLIHPIIGNGRPCTYIACTKPPYPWLESCRSWARGQTDWHWAEIATGHDAMISAPGALASLLSGIAAGTGQPS